MLQDPIDVGYTSSVAQSKDQLGKYVVESVLRDGQSGKQTRQETATTHTTRQLCKTSKIWGHVDVASAHSDLPINNSLFKIAFLNSIKVMISNPTNEHALAALARV